jgi:hypothetical protein
MPRMSQSLKARVRLPHEGGEAAAHPAGWVTRAREHEDDPATWETLAIPHDEPVQTGTR